MTAQLARPVGINHVALEVGDLEAALAFYGSMFAVERVEREPGMAFIELGDQFIALSQHEGAAPDEEGSRHGEGRQKARESEHMADGVLSDTTENGARCPRRAAVPVPGFSARALRG